MTVILMNYMFFATAGTYLYGGVISSFTPARYLKATGSTLDPNFLFLNWNDFGGAFMALYTLNLGTSKVKMTNICDIGTDDHPNNLAGLYFFFFVVLNNMIYFHIFIGILVGIGMEYARGYLRNQLKIVKKNKISGRIKLFNLLHSDAKKHY